MGQKPHWRSLKEEGEQVYMILSGRLPRKGRSKMELKPGEGQGAGLWGGAYRG